jgi:hypothetical protein
MSISVGFRNNDRPGLCCGIRCVVVVCGCVRVSTSGGETFIITAGDTDCDITMLPRRQVRDLNWIGRFYPDREGVLNWGRLLQKFFQSQPDHEFVSV